MELVIAILEFLTELLPLITGGVGAIAIITTILDGSFTQSLKKMIRMSHDQLGTYKKNLILRMQY